VGLITVFPSTDKTRCFSPRMGFAPHRLCASSGVIKSMFSVVGSRAARFSGVLSAGRPVLVIILISGNIERSEEMMYRVPFDMYRLRKRVQPGAW